MQLKKQKKPHLGSYAIPNYEYGGFTALQNASNERLFVKAKWRSLKPQKAITSFVVFKVSLCQFLFLYFVILSLFGECSLA